MKMNLEEFKKLNIDWKKEVGNWVAGQLDNISDASIGDILNEIDEVEYPADSDQFITIPDGFEMPIPEQEVWDTIYDEIRYYARGLPRSEQKPEASNS